ncbi:hypothetical protein MD484_g8508, partial [Candolleomyces efflorescens]
MATTSQRCLARLYRDLEELHEQPYPGVAVFIDDADFREFCLVLTPPAGPWKDLALHFDVRLPPDWPRDPPSVSSTHSLNHPNLSGRNICCDLLKRHNKQGYTGGYSPTLTLRGFFLQFLTFFSSSSVEQESGGSAQLGDAIITTYITDRDMGTTSTPWEPSRRNPLGHLSESGLRDQQLHLRSKWKADGRQARTQPEIRTVSDGRITHKTKGAPHCPDCIHQFKRRSRRWQEAYRSISGWSCTKCPYGTPDLPLDASTANSPMKDAGTTSTRTHAEPGDPLYFVPPLTCSLHLFNDDILLEIASFLPSESIITFGQAYSRFQGLMTGHRIILLRDLRCFFLKTPVNHAILGTGVAFDEDSRVLSSDFDWLSLEAFESHNIRKSILKREFRFFLPLAFNQSHFERAKEEIWKRVASIDAAVRQPNARLSLNGIHEGQDPQAETRDQPHQAFNVLYKMMNDIVVSLMQTCDNVSDPQGGSRVPNTQPALLNASERAVISYCHLMHLLICACRAEPLLLQDVQARAGEFLQSPRSTSGTDRSTANNIGELVVVVTLSLIMSGRPSKQDSRKALFLQAVVRHVRRISAPSISGLGIRVARKDTLTNLFARLKVTLRSIMFQAAFLDLFIEAYRVIGIEALDESYGFPEAGLPEKMVKEIKEIYRVNNWDGFFAKVRPGKPTPREFSSEIPHSDVAIKRTEHRGLAALAQLSRHRFPPPSLIRR